MAFWKTETHSEEKVCAVCRNRITKSYNIEYNGGVAICPACFKRDYMSKGKNLGLVDTDKNLLTQFRPARVYEKPLRIFRGTKVDLAKDRVFGYEMSEPKIMPVYTVMNVVIWCLIVLVFHLVSPVPSDQKYRSLAMIVAYAIQFGVSAAWAVKYIFDIVKGTFAGVGYFRRIILLLAAVVMGWLAFTGLSAVLDINDVSGFPFFPFKNKY